MSDLRVRASNGKMLPRTYIWRDGMPNWDRLQSVPALQDVLQVMPAVIHRSQPPPVRNGAHEGAAANAAANAPPRGHAWPKSARRRRPRPVARRNWRRSSAPRREGDRSRGGGRAGAHRSRSTRTRRADRAAGRRRAARAGRSGSASTPGGRRQGARGGRSPRVGGLGRAGKGRGRAACARRGRRPGRGLRRTGRTIALRRRSG